MENQQFTFEEFLESIKLRKIWVSALKQENDKLKSILQHQFFNHFSEIRKFMYSNGMADGYELECNISIREQILEDSLETVADILFFWICEEDCEVAIFNENQTLMISKIIQEFANQISIPVVLKNL